MTKRENEIQNEVCKILIDSFHPKQIILFGSRAKGRSSTGSDFDFAIETETKPRKEKLTFAKEEIEKISGLYKVDIVFLTEVDDDFKQIILETGKVIYEEGT